MVLCMTNYGMLKFWKSASRCDGKTWAEKRADECGYNVKVFLYPGDRRNHVWNRPEFTKEHDLRPGDVLISIGTFQLLPFVNARFPGVADRRRAGRVDAAATAWMVRVFGSHTRAF